MIFDSISGLNRVHAELTRFLASAERSIRLAADSSGSAGPYDELLGGLEIEKTVGPIYVSLATDRWLRIEGGQSNLEVYAEFFSFRDDEEGNHHHPEHVFRPDYIKRGTLSVIIEADSE
jgi:hypothetical protein